MDMKGKSSGLRRILNACGYSFDGLCVAFRHEAAFRQEVLLAAVLIPVALACRKSGTDKALLVGSVLLVLIVELLNSAIESLTDRVSLEIHPMAKRTKDMASAAVLLSLVFMILTWGLVFLG